MFAHAKSIDANLIRELDLLEQALKEMIGLNINATSRRCNRSCEAVDSNLYPISLLI
jgi:hypothetical protein